MARNRTKTATYQVGITACPYISKRYISGATWRLQQVVWRMVRDK